ncbi:MAG: lipoyl(octanoyl) transferase LipB [Flavitalea sp.]
MKQDVFYRDLGPMPYKEAWDLQEQILAEMVSLKSAARMAKDAGNSTVVVDIPKHQLLFVEHPPVYTLGKSGKMEHVLINDEERAEKGIEFFKINRGGDITFHGPGQLVGYPIFDLEQFYTDIGKYLRNIEEAVIKVLEHYGLKGDRSPGETGVWLDPDVKGKERKICAIGVRCSRWVTMHGFAFNINTDLNYFNYIVPCGIRQKQVTSLQQELGREVNFGEVQKLMIEKMEEVFEIEIKRTRPEIQEQPTRS